MAYLSGRLPALMLVVPIRGDKMQLYNGDCLEIMKNIADKSVDMILCDLPYGTTQNKWDSIIPLDKLWEQYERIIKDNGAIVLTAQTPFDKVLGVSNLKLLKYEWIWEKEAGTGFLNAKKQPLKSHENILVFYKNSPLYNPQMDYGFKYKSRISQNNLCSTNYGNGKDIEPQDVTYENRYPKSVLCFPRDKNGLHPTQKPVALFEYLIKTYTNENDLVLDNCMGSFTTGIACLNTKRNFIGIELDEHYFKVGSERIEKHLETLDYKPKIVYNLK